MSLISVAEQTLLIPFGIDLSMAEKSLESLRVPGIDFADLYFQSVCTESWLLEESLVKASSYHLERGVGIRSLAGEQTGFAYSQDLSPASLGRAIGAVKQIARQGQARSVELCRSSVRESMYAPHSPLEGVSAAEKVSWLREIDRIARSLDPRVIEVMASLEGSHEVVLILASDGTIAADVRPLVHVQVTVIAAQGARRERGSFGAGGRGTYRVACPPSVLAHCAAEAVRKALLNLDAVDAPAGMMPVVLGPGWPAVLLHESVGHGLEGDFNRKQTSAFADRLGEVVASKVCTIIDQGSLPDRRGSLSIDDEGTPTQSTVLIEQGVLKGYLQDKLNARLMGTQSTGNGRRESYEQIPIPRMTNTYLLPGDALPEEIIASVDRGLYAVDFSGGQVDITSGQFVFSTSEAYLIEKGRVQGPVKGATLIGNGTEVLRRVSMVGNDLSFDPGVGSCGKAGQSVPVGVGQPTIKVDAITVGGNRV